MQGITNAPQGGSGGIQWALRTPSNDWTDLFEIVDGCLKAKCHIYIYLKSEGLGIYIPKDLTAPTGVQSNRLYFDVLYTRDLHNNSVVTHRRIDINEGNLTTTSLTTTYKGYTLAISGIDIVATRSTNLGTGTLSKSDLQVYIS